MHSQSILTCGLLERDTSLRRVFVPLRTDRLAIGMDTENNSIADIGCKRKAGLFGLVEQ